MVVLDRIYTRKGDKGQTSMATGKSVSKDSLLIEAIGTVDEVNCSIGLARAINREKTASKRQQGLEVILESIQQQLFDLGAGLATPSGDDAPEWKAHRISIQPSDVEWLETVIDTLNEELQPLTSFVLPGGGMCNSALHQARAICRKAERICVALNKEMSIDAAALPYLNRLSDLLFVASRWVSVHLGEAEILWKAGKTRANQWHNW